MRTTTNNKYLTKSLFVEFSKDGMYTLGDEDKVKGDKVYLSLHKAYVELGDPTEYQFATKYLDSFDHWKAVCKARWFKPALNRMRRELALKIKAQAIQAIIYEANSTSKNAFQANKFLVEKDLVPGVSSDTGATKGTFQENHITKEDYASDDFKLLTLVKK